MKNGRNWLWVRDSREGRGKWKQTGLDDVIQIFDDQSQIETQYCLVALLCFSDKLIPFHDMVVSHFYSLQTSGPFSSH